MYRSLQEGWEWIDSQLRIIANPDLLFPGYGVTPTIIGEGFDPADIIIPLFDETEVPVNPNDPSYEFYTIGSTSQVRIDVKPLVLGSNITADGQTTGLVLATNKPTTDPRVVAYENAVREVLPYALSRAYEPAFKKRLGTTGMIRDGVTNLIISNSIRNADFALMLAYIQYTHLYDFDEQRIREGDLIDENRNSENRSARDYLLALLSGNPQDRERWFQYISMELSQRPTNYPAEKLHTITAHLNRYERETGIYSLMKVSRGYGQLISPLDLIRDKFSRFYDATGCDISVRIPREDDHPTTLEN
jgi:hypothetical protein